MKELLEDILYTLNQLPNRKVKGRDFTTYELASKIEVKLKLLDAMLTVNDIIEDLKKEQQ